MASEQRDYTLRDIRSMYPAVREDHLRYLQKWGLLKPAALAGGEKHFGFAELAIVKQVSAELERGVPFRTVVRSLVAEQEGQLAFEFQLDAQPAKVVQITRHARSAAAGHASHAPGAVPLPPHPLTRAEQLFLDGSLVDDGTEEAQEPAAAAYRHALELDPNLVPALINLANLYYTRDRLAEAQALYERAARLDPGSFEGHFNLGNVHHNLGRYEPAIECYQQALELNPDYADAHFYLAVTLEKAGRSQDAKRHWRAYEKLAPNGEWVELAREFSES